MSGKRWPELRAAQDIPCDGVNPLTGRVCLLGRHRGHHRDADGAHWLDDEENDEPPALHTSRRPGWDRPFDPHD